MNSAVTATGMSVKATTGTNLTISNATDGTYAFTANLDTASSLIMKPATSFNGTTFYKAKVDASAYDNYAISGLSYANWSEKMDTTTGDPVYVLTGTYYLKALEADSFNRIACSFDVKQDATTVSDTIAKALRCAITIGTTTKIYAPITGYDSTYTTNNGTSDLETPTISGDDALFTQLIGTTAVPVTVSIWFEGQDSNCTSKNAVSAISTTNYSFTITFTGSKV